MSRRSAFDEQFGTGPLQFWDGQLVMSTKPSEQEVVQAFVDDIAPLLEDQRYAYHYVRENKYMSWVKWHGGQNEEGEPCNAWWLHNEYDYRVRGAKRVWVLWPDYHYIRFGHQYHPQIDEHGFRKPLRDCAICGRQPGALS